MPQGFHKPEGFHAHTLEAVMEMLEVRAARAESRGSSALEFSKSHSMGPDYWLAEALRFNTEAAALRDVVASLARMARNAKGETT